MFYFYSGNEYFLSCIASRGDLTEENDAGGIIKDEPCSIAKFLLVFVAKFVLNVMLEPKVDLYPVAIAPPRDRD